MNLLIGFVAGAAVAYYFRGAVEKVVAYVIGLVGNLK